MTVLTRRRFLATGTALALGAAVPTLTACTPRRAPTVTIRVYLSLTAYERGVITRRILPPFTEATGIAVTLATGTTSEAIEGLPTNRDHLDLLAIDTEQLGPLIRNGLAQEVEGERGKVGPPFYQSILPALTSNNRLFALPYRPTTWVGFYNRARFDSASLTPPATWDDLLAVAGKLRDQGGNSLATIQGAADNPAAQSLVELIWAFGGDPFVLTDAGSRAAGDFLARLGPALAPGTRDAKFDTVTRDLGNDRLAYGPNWPAVAADLLQRGGKRDIAAVVGLAGPSGGPRVVSGQVLVVPRGAAQRDRALTFAAHLRDRTVQATLARELAWFPARDDAADSAPAWQQQIALTARDALKGARALPPLAQREAFEALLGDAFRQIAFAGQAPGPMLEQASAKVKSIS